MIKILSESEPGTLAVSISGKLDHDDYTTLEPELQLRADRESDFDLLVELTDIDGLDAAAIRDDLSFTKKFAGDIDKMAVVTQDGPWGMLTKFVGEPLGSVLDVDVERFDSRVEAWKWLRGDAAESD